MRKSFCFSLAFLLAALFSLSSFAQSVTINGTVKHAATGDNVPAASVTVKGGTAGTFTDANGNFRLSVPGLPVTLVISSIGFETQEVSVTSAETPVTVSFAPASALGQEVVVSATRTPQRILETPVSIERMSAATIRNAAVPNYYEALANLKGVDLTTSSFTFRTVSTRGFNGSGNLRFNQLTDGMDNQAPGLNFSVGSIIGPTELDIDNVELLPGASSALYGSGGMNGTMLITSKNPFRYQGLSFQIKQGINHTDGSQRAPAPYYDWSLRWAKTIGEKFAFKVSGQFIQAQDWQASDRRNLSRNNVFSSIKTGDRQNDPNYDGVNVFGDEANASMGSIAQAAIFGPSNPTLGTVVQGLAQALGRAPTQAEIVGAYSANPAFGPLNLFARGLTQGYYGGQLVSRTGYDENAVVDYNAYNVRLTSGLYYKVTDNIEASLIGYWGSGTTVYTGADRYALKNLIMAQYKAELRSNKWFLRAYTTQENSGDSYTATTAAVFVNRAWRSDADWFGTYSATYSGARTQGASNTQAHGIARNAADQGRLLPGSQGFEQAFNTAIKTPISKGGAGFADRSDMYHAEGQYNLSDIVKVADVLVGATFRRYSLNSNGTIFADTTGAIGINEAGAYLQAQRMFFNEFLKLTGSIRYDKNENFEGRFTPRLTALLKVAKDNNLRLSYQTAYRFPSTQDQYINLLTGGVNRLVGGLPQFETFFKFNTNPAYTSESIVAYRNTVAAGTPNPALLRTAQFPTIRPETMRSFEVGYRGLVTPRILVDGYAYYSRYENFIGRVAVGRGKSGNPAGAPTELASPFTTDNYSFVVNSNQAVNGIGWGASIDYNIAKGYIVTANFSSDRLNNVPEGLVTFYNTPKLRYNIGFSNNSLTKTLGFNIQYRWQDEVFWQGTFGTGDVPSFGSVDAQLSYRIPNTKSQFKLGGSNIFNNYYTSAFGNPQVGGLYYVSFGYNIF